MVAKNPLYPFAGGDHALGFIATYMGNQRPIVSSVSFTRPDNTTAYSAGDAIAPPPPEEGDAVRSLVFPQAIPSGSTAFLLQAVLLDMATETTSLDADLMLFSGPMEADLVDGEAFAPTVEDMGQYLTTVSFSGSASEAVGAATVYEVVPNKPLSAAPESVDLHGVLVAKNSYTPIAEEGFILKLGLMPRVFGLFS